MDKINIFLLLISCIFGVVYGHDTNSTSIGQKQLVQWCIAQPSAPQEELQGFIDYSCGVVDCSAIQPGGSCYYPTMVVSHADYALNMLYRVKGSCNLYIAKIVTDDPSYGYCNYP
ncbi:hypothetical protein ACP275_07G062600 [Erythranthe tilingii]